MFLPSRRAIHFFSIFLFSFYSAAMIHVESSDYSGDPLEAIGKPEATSVYAKVSLFPYANRPQYSRQERMIPVVTDNSFWRCDGRSKHRSRYRTILRTCERARSRYLIHLRVSARRRVSLDVRAPLPQRESSSSATRPKNISGKRWPAMRMRAEILLG